MVSDLAKAWNDCMVVYIGKYDFSSILNEEVIMDKFLKMATRRGQLLVSFVS